MIQVLNTDRPLMDFYPEIEPYHHDHLRVSSLHSLYYEECGNKAGIPVIFLHGGPGGGLDPEYRRYFDPKKYRIILLDQRGCGKSTPFAELQENTTWDLVADIEKLRDYLEIKAWSVFGGSWGSTLALAYAVTHPEQVLNLVLRGIFLCRNSELRWFYEGEGANWIYPDEWKKYVSFIPFEERYDFMSAYYRRLTSADETLQLKAAQIWSAWEAACSRLLPKASFVQAYEEPHKALPFARIESHYFHHRAFFATDNYLLEQVPRIRHIPCRIIQGRYDIVCPAKSAYDLHEAFPEAELYIIPDSGHAASETGTRSELIRATNHFAG